MAERADGWRCSGASITGRSHEREGLDCQDAWSVHFTDRDRSCILAACVCDGAGSAKNGQAGAKLASTMLARWLGDNFEKALSEEGEADALLEAFGAVREAMERQAAQGEGSLRQYACTVVVVAVGVAGQWLAWHLGDGGIIVQFPDSIRVLSRPKKGEFANVTQFITDADVHTQVECYNSRTYEPTLRPIGFALFTDGIEGSLFNKKTGEVAPAINAMLRWHETADQAQVSGAIRENLQEVFRKMTDDDCTLVLLRRLSRDPSERPTVREVQVLLEPPPAAEIPPGGGR